MARKPRAEPAVVRDDDGRAFADIPDLIINSILADKRRKEAVIREAANAARDRTAPVLKTIYRGKASREDLHALLDECLNLQCHSDYLEPAANNLGRELAQALLVGSAAWVDRPEDPADGVVRAAARKDIPSTREAIALTVMRMPALMRHEDRRLLVDALHSLNDGTGSTPDFLKPSPRAALHGKDPEAIPIAEDMILFWHAWRTGQIKQIKKHGSVEQAYRDLQDAGGPSKGAAYHWFHRAYERHGRSQFEEKLSEYKARGMNGQSFTDFEMTLKDLIKERARAKEASAESLRKQARNPP